MWIERKGKRLGWERAQVVAYSPDTDQCTIEYMTGQEIVRSRHHSNERKKLAVRLAGRFSAQTAICGGGGRDASAALVRWAGLGVDSPFWSHGRVLTLICLLL